MDAAGWDVPHRHLGTVAGRGPRGRGRASLWGLPGHRMSAVQGRVPCGHGPWGCGSFPPQGQDSLVHLPHNTQEASDVLAVCLEFENVCWP